MLHFLLCPLGARDVCFLLASCSSKIRAISIFSDDIYVSTHLHKYHGAGPYPYLSTTYHIYGTRTPVVPPNLAQPRPEIFCRQSAVRHHYRMALYGPYHIHISYSYHSIISSSIPNIKNQAREVTDGSARPMLTIDLGTSILHSVRFTI